MRTALLILFIALLFGACENTALGPNDRLPTLRLAIVHTDTLVNLLRPATEGGFDTATIRLLPTQAYPEVPGYPLLYTKTQFDHPDLGPCLEFDLFGQAPWDEYLPLFGTNTYRKYTLYLSATQTYTIDLGLQRMPPQTRQYLSIDGSPAQMDTTRTVYLLRVAPPSEARR